MEFEYLFFKFSILGSTNLMKNWLISILLADSLTIKFNFPILHKILKHGISGKKEWSNPIKPGEVIIMPDEISKYTLIVKNK